MIRVRVASALFVRRSEGRFWKRGSVHKVESLGLTSADGVEPVVTLARSKCGADVDFPQLLDSPEPPDERCKKCFR